ncbi:hypothetical protein L207DRAFT_387863, partial [Hyaloscypha variabilis F]
INNILINYLDEFYITYLDNILIYSKDPLEYNKYIYKANIKKSEFSVKRTKYLGYILTTKGLEIDPKKV